MAELLEKELSYQIQKCFFGVVNKYGKGLKENIYQKILAEELEKAGLSFEQQKRIDIFSFESGKKLGVYVPDFVIEDKVILEIKSSAFTTKSDLEQQRSYLRVSRYEIGYLVNFSTDKLFIKRSIYTNDRKSFIATLEKVQKNS